MLPATPRLTSAERAGTRSSREIDSDLVVDVEALAALVE